MQPIIFGHKKNNKDAILASAVSWKRPQASWYNNLSNSKLGGNELSKQVNATNAVDGFVDRIDDGIDGIDGLDGINTVLMNLMNLVSKLTEMEGLWNLKDKP